MENTKKITKITLAVLAGMLMFFALPDFALGQSYSVDFTQYIYTKNNPQSRLSSLTGSVNLPFDGKYEITAHFRADSGNLEQYEEFNVFVDGSKMGKTTDPNQGDDYEVQKIGEFQFAKGSRQVKVEHAYTYSQSIGYQGVYPLEIVFKLISQTETNHAPIANAGPDKQVNENQTVVLNGSGSDPDSDAITYSWSCTGGSLSNSNIAQPTFNAPSVSANTNYTCTLTVRDEHGLTASDSAIVLVSNIGCQNNPPIANAGPDRQVDENNSITIQGSASDPNSDPISYSWTCNGGSLSNNSIIQPVFNAPSVSKDTTYTCTLKVTELTECGLSASDSMNILVKNKVAQNNPPIANAGSDREVYENKTINLLGSGSDPDNDNITYSWSCTGGSLSNSNIAQPTFNAPSVSANTNYTCTLTVRDEHGLTNSDSTSVLVRNEIEQNNPPVADAGSDKEIYENESITINGSGSDPDNDNITYSWSCTGGDLSNKYIARPVFDAPSVSYDRNYTCTLTVEDEHGAEDSDSMTVRVLDEDENEQINIETYSAINIERNRATLRGNLTELEGSDYAYVYFEWGRTDSYGNETSEQYRSGTGLSSRDISGLSYNTLYHFRAIARSEGDEMAYGQDRTFRTSDTDNNNEYPVADAGPDREVYSGESITITGYGYDPDGGSVDYYWSCTGGNLANRYNSNLSLNAPNISSNTYYTCTLEVTDDESDSDEDEMRILVRVRETNNYSVSVEKSARNMSRGDQAWQSYLYASTSDIVAFRINITSNNSAYLSNVMVRDILPSNLLYQGNLKINDVSDSRNLSVQAIDIGGLSYGQTKTITFWVKIASGENFNYGTTELINTVNVYNTNFSQTATSRVAVRKSGVAGISTGITNKFVFDSLLFPLLFSLALVWIFKSKLLGLDKLIEERVSNIICFRAKRKLDKKIESIKNRI